MNRTAAKWAPLRANSSLSLALLCFAHLPPFLANISASFGSHERLAPRAGQRPYTRP